METLTTAESLVAVRIEKKITMKIEVLFVLRPVVDLNCVSVFNLWT
jgi:hypothetical protein